MVDSFLSVRPCQGLKTYRPIRDLISIYIYIRCHRRSWTSLLSIVTALLPQLRGISTCLGSFRFLLRSFTLLCQRKPTALRPPTALCQEDQLQNVALRYYVSHYGSTCLVLMKPNDGAYQGSKTRSFDLSAIGLTAVLHLQRTSKPESSQLSQLFLPRPCGSCRKLAFWSRLCLLSCVEDSPSMEF